eukprot:scaffold5043_cov115-Isochrysis_galbana.AAC.12
MAAAAAAQRIKAMRTAAASKLLSTAERARRAAELLRGEGADAAQAVGAAGAEILRVAQALQEHVPQPRAAGDSDEEYF